MTSKNSSWNNQPFLLKPAGKDYIWGGMRLNEVFGKDIDMSPLAETWECSTHPEGLSTIRGGCFHGRTLKSVLDEHPEYAGEVLLPEGQLPILIKLIDAREDLSVQVHPDDAYAKEHEQGALGKYEMWYVLDACKDSYLVYGFHHNLDKETVRQNLLQGTIRKFLQYVPIKKDEVFYIEPGQVHAIGAGALIAEIQQNSNITYRLYDYDRLDKNGQPRPLHLDKALDVIQLKGSNEPRQPMRVLRYQRGCASELLCRCKHFQVERLLVNKEVPEEISFLKPLARSFQALLCVEGQGTLIPDSGDAITFSKGDCIFIPANCPPMKLQGNTQLLKVNC